MEARVYEFVCDYIEANGYSPSYREIARGCGLRSISTVNKYLYSLAAKGKLSFVPGIARTIHLTGVRT